MLHGVAKAALLTAAAMLAGCGESTAAPTTHPSTAAAQTSQYPQRIVSLVPAATLNLVLMGSSDRLVGGTRYDRLYLPEPQSNLPVVGDYESTNYEALASLKPTAVIVQKDEARIEARLRDLAARSNFEIVNIRLDKIDDIWTTARALGRAAGTPEAAESAIRDTQATLKEVAQEVTADKKKPRVLYVATPRSMMIAGGETIMGEMVALAGGINAGAEIGKNFPIVSREAVVNLAPEVILLGAPDEPEQLINDPRLEMWSALQVPAARNGRIYLVTGGNSQMASLEIGKHVRALARLIHREPGGNP